MAKLVFRMPVITISSNSSTASASPITMAIIKLQELALIYIIDSESVIDLHQYLGRPDDCSKSDNEEDYAKDEEGNMLDLVVEEDYESVDEYEDGDY